MRKNPNNDLKWLEDQLKAVEETELSQSEEHDEADQWLDIMEEFSPEPAGFEYALYEDEEFDEETAVLPETKRQRKQRLKQEKKLQKQQKKVKKKKGIGGLVLLALLEIIGILAIIGWWIQWLT